MIPPLTACLYADGTGTVIDDVIVEKDGEEGEGDVKVDPTPTTDKDQDTGNADLGDDTNDAATGEGNSFRFVNTYTKTTGENPDTPINPGFCINRFKKSSW